MSNLATVDLVHRATEAARSLAEPTQKIEKVFLEVGAELSNCARLLQQIVAQFESLPSEFRDEGLSQATERLAHVGMRLLGISDEMDGSGSELAQLSTILSNASPSVDRLQRTVRMMAIVATNARIGAASLSETQDGFGNFAEDVTALANSMNTAVSKFFETYRELSHTVSDVASAQAKFASSQRKPLANAAALLNGTLEKATEQRVGVLAQSEEVGRQSREIVNKVAEIVMAMQSGDAVRQRLEHVQTALGLAQQETLEAVHILRLLDLQQRQLTGAREMLNNEMDIAASSVIKLVDDVDALLSQSTSVRGKTETSAMAALRRVVEDNILVLRECEAERYKFDTTAADVSIKVKSMLHNVASVEHLEQEMLVVSLNAAIRCARLDQRGRALNVIAQQLRDLTKETLLVAGEAVSILRQAADVSEKFATSLAMNDAASISRLEEQAIESLEFLTGFDERLNGVILGLSQDVPLVKEKLTAVSRLLEHSRSIDLAFRRTEEAVAVSEYVPSDTGDASELYDSWRAIYTMDAERRIHDDFVGKTSGTTDREDNVPDVWI